MKLYNSLTLRFGGACLIENLMLRYLLTLKCNKRICLPGFPRLKPEDSALQ
jgi:hypothetical protein